MQSFSQVGRYCIRCGMNNSLNDLKCQKCYAVLTMLIPTAPSNVPPSILVFVQFIPTGMSCHCCEQIGKKFWYTLASKETNDIRMRLCGDCLSSVFGELVA